jgi:radical SAM protein with 4Fe4S-binding SPASM domain
MQWEVETEDVLSVIRQAVELGAQSIMFTGGEVFMRSDTTKIVEYAVERGCRVTLVTNGTLLTQTRVRQLAEISRDLLFAVSLDGVKPETHEMLRGVPGCYELAIRGIRNLQKEGFPLQIISVLNKLNVEEIPSLIQFVREDLCAESRILLMIPWGRAQENQELLLPVNETYRFLQQVIFPWMRRDKRVHVDLPLALTPPDLETKPICPWGFALMGTSPDGYIGLCERLENAPDLCGGHVRSHSLKGIWESDFYQTLRNISGENLKGICGNCVAANICRGRCRVNAYHQSGGDLYAPEPICQSFFQAGLFPRYAMLDSAKACDYNSARYFVDVPMYQ